MTDTARDRHAPTLVPLIGISQRCGTHWLSDLLTSHPDCRRPMARRGTGGADWEDLLLEGSDLLVRYASRTRQRWDPAFRTPALEDRLLASLGTGLARFATDPDDTSPDQATHVVTKSPTADGLEHLPRLWPGARPVLLVRDGADVVASATASFGGLAERWIRVWRAGAHSIITFLDAHPGIGLLVRYEDVVEDLAGSLVRICDHVGLDPANLDLDAARRLGVRGSSQAAGGAGPLSWEPAHPERFEPVGRGRDLPDDVRERLGWLAGDELRALGYAVPDAGRPAGHRLRDVAWSGARLTRRAVGTVRR